VATHAAKPSVQALQVAQLERCFAHPDQQENLEFKLRLRL
jgi:hypothetical protein